MTWNQELEEMVVKALPEVTCKIENTHVLHRRQRLRERIKAYIEKQLSAQFNAKPTEC